MAKEDPEAIQRTLLAAEEGDLEAKAKVERWSKTWTVETVHKISSLAHQVRTRSVTEVTSTRPTLTICLMRREAELVGESMLRPNATPVERLLAEQIGINWLAVRIAELALAESNSPVWLSRLESAHRRLMTSIKTLAQVQRLQIPNFVQVNIAEQNVTVT